jgi:hypothetical protein
MARDDNRNGQRTKTKRLGNEHIHGPPDIFAIGLLKLLRKKQSQLAGVWYIRKKRGIGARRRFVDRRSASPFVSRLGELPEVQRER